MSTCKTLFTTTDEIKACTPISDNVDDAKFSFNIEYAQISALRPVLSTSLYNEIDAQIVASTLTALNTLLLDTYIKPFLAQKVLALSLLNLWTQITPTGVHLKNPADATSVDSSGLKMMINQAEAKADHYQTLMVDYLSVNSADYPEYTTTSTEERREDQPSRAMIIFDNDSRSNRRCCRNWPLCACAND